MIVQLYWMLICVDFFTLLCVAFMTVYGSFVLTELDTIVTIATIVFVAV